GRCDRALGAAHAREARGPHRPAVTARGAAGVRRRRPGYFPVTNRCTERPTAFIPSQSASPKFFALSWSRSPTGLLSPAAPLPRRPTSFAPSVIVLPIPLAVSSTPLPTFLAPSTTWSAPELACATAVTGAAISSAASTSRHIDAHPGRGVTAPFAPAGGKIERVETPVPTADHVRRLDAAARGRPGRGRSARASQASGGSPCDTSEQGSHHGSTGPAAREAEHVQRSAGAPRGRPAPGGPPAPPAAAGGLPGRSARVRRCRWGARA